MTDEYAASGEFIDILIRDPWTTAFRAPVTYGLRGIDPAAGPLVDLGAGSGRGVVLLAEIAPTAMIQAVEPSPVLRAVLLARLADNADLCARVSVIAGRAEAALLPERLGGVIAMNMIGHLAPEDRRTLWREIAGRLAPGAPLVLNLQPPERPEPIPESPFTSVRIGSHTYVGAGGAEPAGIDSVVWRMRYRVLDDGGQVLREVASDYRWYVLDSATLVAELTEAGLLVHPLASGVYRAVRK